MKFVILLEVKNLLSREVDFTFIEICFLIAIS